MPMQRSKYPPDWEIISLRIRERAGWKCELCGAEQGQPNPATGSKVVLTVMHLNHDTTDNTDANLKAGCQRCHLRYDAKYHATNARVTRRRQRAERGQLEMVV